MTPNQEADFLKLISKMYAFYRQAFSDFDGSVWWFAMKHYEFEAVSDAIMRQMVNPDNGQFLPKPADVVRMLGGTTKDRAALAWSKVDFAIRTAGPWESVVFEGRHIHIVIAEMGGWVKLCESPGKDYPFVENDFVARYRAAILRSDVTHPSHLVGISESHNVVQGMPSMAPLAIGDAARCSQVYATGIGGPEPGKRQLLAAKPPTLTLAHDNTKNRIKKLK